MRMLLLLYSLLVVGALPTVAQDEPDQSAIDEANRLGQLLFAYDQAAWHGTDAVMPALERDTDSLQTRAEGYVVEELPDGWRVAFGTVAADSAAFLVGYEAILDSKYSVRDTRIHYPAKPETGFLLNAMLARNAAVSQFVPSVETRHNTAVLPGLDGTLYAYVLPSQPETNVYIVGGDARYTFDPDSRTVVDARDLHSDFQVYDLRNNTTALTSGRALAFGVPVETDVFYALSRPAEEPKTPNHYVFSKDWVFFLSKSSGVGAQLTRQGFIRIYGVDADESQR